MPWPQNGYYPSPNQQQWVAPHQQQTQCEQSAPDSKVTAEKAHNEKEPKDEITATKIQEHLFEQGIGKKRGAKSHVKQQVVRKSGRLAANQSPEIH